MNRVPVEKSGITEAGTVHATPRAADSGTS